MSEQQPQSADAALELNNELKARRENSARCVKRAWRF